MNMSLPLPESIATTRISTSASIRTAAAENYSVQDAFSHSETSFHDGLRTLSPLLACREISLWKQPHRRGIFLAVTGITRRTWQKRCMLLVQNDVHSSCSLLFYNTAESQGPTTTVRLFGGGNSFSVSTVEDHPRFLELQISPPSAAALNDGGDGHRLEQGQLWRLKFSDIATVQLWRDALSGLQQQQHLITSPPLPIWETSISTSADDGYNTSRDSTLPQQQEQHRSSVDSYNSDRVLIVLWKLLVALSVPVTLIILNAAHTQFHNVPRPNNIKMDFLKNQQHLLRVGLSKIDATIKHVQPRNQEHLVKPPSLPITGTSENNKTQRKLERSDRMVDDSTSDTSSFTVLTWSSWIDEMAKSLHPFEAAITPAPYQQTYIRMIVNAIKQRYLVTTNEVLTSGSLIHDYFWSVLFATILLSTSVLSILSRLISLPRGSHFGLGGILLLSTAILLAHDTIVNHWQQALYHSLYWRGHAQGVLALVLLGGSRIWLMKALKWERARRPISTARKATSALSALLASLSLPLTLQSLRLRQYESDINGESGVVVFLSVATFFAFFIGIHFFGWARKDLKMGAVPVGELIYQFSLLPANIALYFLAVVGDVSKFIVTNVYWVVVDMIWERACIPCGYKMLLLCDRLHHLFQDAILERCLYPFLHMTKYIVLQPIYGVSLVLVGCIESALFRIGSFFETILRCIHCHVFRPLLRFVERICDFIYTYSITLSQLSLRVCVVVWDTTLRSVSMLVRRLVNHILLPILGTLHRTISALEHTLRRCTMFTVKACCILQATLKLAFLFLYDQLCRYASELLRLGTMIFDNYFIPPINSVVQVIITPIHIAIMQHVVPALRYALAAAHNATIHFIAAFLQKFWLLIPTCLVFNGSYLFAQAGMTSNTMGTAARMQYAAGSWTFFLIGCTILHAMISSQGNLVHQHVVVEESILKYFDLGLFKALTRIFVSGWHALSTMLGLVLSAFDFLIRKGSKRIWWLLTSFHVYTMQPLAAISASVLRSIWDSPYCTMVFSLSGLSVIYLHHTEHIEFNLIPTWKAWFGPTSQLIFAIVNTTSCSLYERLPALQARLTMNAYNSIFAAVVPVDVSSPGVAFCCWVITCLLTKTRARVRIKMFGVPVVALYAATGVDTIALLQVSCVASLCWILVSLIVDDYEEHAGRLAMEELSVFRSGGVVATRHASTLELSASRNPLDYDQTECVVCLEVLEPHHQQRDDLLSTLPCGHTFHTCCVNEWINTSHQYRCPVCRRAIGGWDRVLEIAF